MIEGKSLRVAYGRVLVELGTKNNKIVVMGADLAHATTNNIFMGAYPDCFFNFDIVEASFVCVAVGFAHSNLIPFAGTFALFGTGRTYEQIRNGVAYINTSVKSGLSHSGLCVDEDSGNRQSIEDLALIRVVPNVTIFVSCDPIEAKKAVPVTVEVDGPVYIRAARPVCGAITEEDTPFILGKASIMRDGTDVYLVTTGLVVPEALKTAELLAADGVSAAVVNVHTIKSLDDETIFEMAGKCGAIVSVEEHSIIGGLSSAVTETLAGKSSVKFDRVGVIDGFGKFDKPADLFHIYGLTPENAVAKAKVLLK